SPLTGMADLRFLSFDAAPGAAPFSDLRPLAGLGRLERLSLTGHQVSDVSPLAGLGHLAYLALRDNAVGDISLLAGRWAARPTSTRYHEAGPGWVGTGQRLNSDRNPGASASWQFDNLPAGDYEVVASWTAQDGRSQRVTYQVSGAAGPFVVNQALV